MDKAFLSKVLKLIDSGLTILEKKKITKYDLLEFKIDVYNTLKEEPESLKMFMECIKKLEKNKGDIHYIIGKNSLGTNISSRKSSSRKSSSRRRSSRSKSLATNSSSSRRINSILVKSKSLARGLRRRTRRSGRSGRARGNSNDVCDEDNMCSVCWNNITTQDIRISHNTDACRHTFHRRCVTGWWTADTSKNNTCPKCNIIPENVWITENPPVRFARVSEHAINNEVPEDIQNISHDRLRALAEYVVDHERNLFERMNPEDRRLYELIINQYQNTEIGERFERAMVFHMNTRIIQHNARAPYINIIIFVLFLIMANKIESWLGRG